MKTDPIAVEQKTLARLLDKVDLFAQYCDMSRRESSNMSLLAEEMILSVRNILDACDGVVWMEYADRAFEVHLQIDAIIDETARAKFLAMRTPGAAAKPQGFLARVGQALDNWLFAVDATPGDLYMALPGSEGLYGAAPAEFWSLSYHDYVKREQALAPKREQAPDELEGIERTIIESIADDITVTVRNTCVELIAVKNAK